MSNFKTQVNFSTQIKEYPNTDGTLSGSVNVQQYTILGTDYLDLPLGLDGSSTGITSTFFPTTYGTFTGTTGSTTFFFSDQNMDLGIPYLSAITPSNSGVTQNVEVYIPLTTIIVDGNSFDIYYSGVSYDLVASNMYEYIPGEFSGITFTNVLEYLSGTTYPWWFLKSGSTTWNEVKGRTQTDRLTITEGANTGYVLTSSNSNGDAVWLPGGGGSFTGGTGSCITDLYVTNVHGCSPITFWDQLQHNGSTASTIYNTAFGYQTQSLGNYSHSEGIYTIASGNGSHAGGYGVNSISKIIASSTGSFNHSVVDNTYSGTGASSLGSFILGGYNNSVSMEWCGVIGGAENRLKGGGLPVTMYSVIVGGTNNTIYSGYRSVILGGNSMTGTSNDTVYVPDFVIKKVASVPTSATDTIGEIGSVTYDNDWLYIKTPRSGGLWGRVALNTSW